MLLVCADRQGFYVKYKLIFRLGGRRFSEGTSADREIQRTLMEVSSFVG